MTMYPSTYDIGMWVQQVSTSFQNVSASIALIAQEMRRANDLKEEIYRQSINSEDLGPR